MPRTGERRPLIAVKISQAAIDEIDDRAARRAEAEGRSKSNRSDEIRLMLAYAQGHMPDNWVPEHREPAG